MKKFIKPYQNTRETTDYIVIQAEAELTHAPATAKTPTLSKLPYAYDSDAASSDARKSCRRNYKRGTKFTD